jgi:hypothetical protein
MADSLQAALNLFITSHSKSADPLNTLAAWPKAPNYHDHSFYHAYTLIVHRMACQVESAFYFIGIEQQEDTPWSQSKW